MRAAGAPLIVVSQSYHGGQARAQELPKPSDLCHTFALLMMMMFITILARD